MMTDYDLIVEQAQKQGFEFFILQGKAYFRKKDVYKRQDLTAARKESPMMCSWEPMVVLEREPVWQLSCLLYTSRCV